MDFHAITPVGEVHILSTDDDGRILTPLSSPPPGAAPAQPAPANLTKIQL